MHAEDESNVQNVPFKNATLATTVFVSYGDINITRQRAVFLVCIY
jgi:hypothetical protein